MERHWKYFILLAWFSYLLVAGILLFARGFLLTRETIFEDVNPKTNSSCSKIDEDKSTILLKEKNANFINMEECIKDDLFFTSNQYKVILVVIDALKFEFALHDEFSQEEAYKNKLTIIRDLLKNKPEHSRLYQFIADPPTTTMQRLKGITTGSLPTFIDIGSNFDTPEINEDNIIDQLIRKNKNVVFLGDDTWSGLYPRRFLREFSYPSFNVWDLDTVDNGIKNHLLPEIKKDDWNLLISHFLGVDHCGHRYGPHHPEMSRKLREMNIVISDIISIMDNSTILFIIGDHGMTTTGDHGGESEAEVTAAMFVYSPVPLVSSSIVPHSSIVSQIDLVPTLSTILGVKIPFSNLGSLVLDALPSFGNGNDTLPEWKVLLNSLWQNVEQTSHYIQQYSRRTNQLPKDKLLLLDEKYLALEKRVKKISSKEDFKKFAQLAKDYLQFLKEMCKEIWIQFGALSISHGLIITFLTLFLSSLLVDGLSGDKLQSVLIGSFGIAIFGATILITVGTYFCHYMNIAKDLVENIYFFTNIVTVFFMCVTVFQNWQCISDSWYKQLKSNDFSSIISRLLVILSAASVFSNSFIVEEANVISFFIVTLLCALLYDFKLMKSSQGSQNVDKSFVGSLVQLTSSERRILCFGFILCISIRLSHYFWRCREEQIGCESYVTHKPHSSATVTDGKYRNAECLFTLVCIAFFVTVTRMWLRSCGNLASFSTTTTLTKYCPNVIVVCIGGFWVLQSLPRDTKQKFFLPWQLQFLPWIIYALMLAALLSLFIQPLCVYIVPKKKENIISLYGQENAIPHLFKHVKSMMQEQKNTKITASGDNNIATENLPVVYGLATVYSAVFVTATIFIGLLITLLLGDVLAPSAILMISTAAVVLYMLSAIKYEKAVLSAQLFIVPWSSIICWGFLATYYFYGTGHQPTFPAIHWDAAFVGTGGQFTNHIIPGLLISVNTFASHLIFSITLPLLIIAPFTLQVMLPKYIFTRQSGLKEETNGELSLLWNKDLMFQEMFSLCMKYIMFHGIKVFACMLAATIHCRHLMVWKIFAPKFIFESLSFFVTVPGVCIAYLIVIRVTNEVESLLKRLQEYCR